MILKNMIPLRECRNRTIYEIYSRNLPIGVFVKDRAGFIGIREKFDSKYLFMEYHYDTGAPFGTVQPIKELNCMLPEDIPLSEDLETIDRITKRPVAFDRPVVDGGKGWYFIDTGEASERIEAASVPNEKLFDFLENVENTVMAACAKCKRRVTPSRLNANGACSACETGFAPRR